jgi:hypothetical protein
MDAELHRLVRERSGGRCEYCRLPEAESLVPFEIEHIIPRKHRGRTVTGNLAWSCVYCHSFKGSDLSGIDKTTRKPTPLFNPRRHKWATRFRWEGPYLVGRTTIGRVTVALLHINDEYRVELCEMLIEAGEFRLHDPLHPGTFRLESVPVGGIR